MHNRSPWIADALLAFAVLAFVSIAGAVISQYRGGYERSEHPAVTLEELRSHMGARDAVILDVREAAAFAAGHVPGAFNLPADHFQSGHEALLRQVLAGDRERLVIVYGEDTWSGLAEQVQQGLIDRGHRHVGLFNAGWAAWRTAAFPEEKQP